ETKRTHGELLGSGGISGMSGQRGTGNGAGSEDTEEPGTISLRIAVDGELHATVELATLVVAVVGDREPLALADELDLGGRQSEAGDEPFLDRLRATARQIHVVGVGADGVGVPLDDQTGE